MRPLLWYPVKTLTASGYGMNVNYVREVSDILRDFNGNWFFNIIDNKDNIHEYLYGTDEDAVYDRNRLLSCFEVIL